MKIELLKNCKDLQELKSMYRKLAFVYHPDKATGSVELMQKLNAEYEYLSNHLGEEQANINSFIEVIEKLINVQGIVIELVGSWIWVSGDTKPVKELLSELHFFYNRKRTLWQLKPQEEEYKRTHSKASDGEIKEKYGCKVIKNNFKPVLS